MWGDLWSNAASPIQTHCSILVALFHPCDSRGHVSWNNAKRKTRTSEDVPFHVRELGLKRGEGTEGSVGRFVGRWGAELQQAWLNLHPTLYACLCSPAMHSAGGRENLSPSSGNYSELVRHVWCIGMHLSFIRCLYMREMKWIERKLRKSAFTSL